MGRVGVAVNAPELRLIMSAIGPIYDSASNVILPINSAARPSGPNCVSYTYPRPIDNESGRDETLLNGLDFATLVLRRLNSPPT